MMKKLFFPVILMAALSGCSDSPAEKQNEAMEEYHEEAAENADDADLPELEQMHEDSADLYDNQQ